MTKPQLIASAVVGWIAIHGGLVAVGAVLGVGLSIPFLPHGDSPVLQCQEDEVAIHGGLANWYDPNLPLECVNFEDFPELHAFDIAQFEAETYRDGFQEGYNEGLSDAANTEIGEAWSEPPTPGPTPTPAPPVEKTSKLEEFERMRSAIVQSSNANSEFSPAIKLCLSEPVEATLNLLSFRIVDSVIPFRLTGLGHIVAILQSNLCLRALDSQIREQCPDALCRLVGTAIPSELWLAVLREELRVINHANLTAEHLREEIDSLPMGLLNEDSQGVTESLSLPTSMTNNSDAAIGIDDPSEISENVSIHTDSITYQEGVVQVALTFYTCEPFCLGDPMYNGAPLHLGAVACGWALQDGQRFEFEGDMYTCEDRGGAVSAYWVDFWMPDLETGKAWQARVGTVGEIILIGVEG